MRSRLQDITSHLSPEFIRLLGATIGNDADGTHLVIANERFPVIDGIPILLKEPRRYLRRLSGFLETQLEKLQQFCEYPGDRFWAEPQSRELQKRLMAVRSVLLEAHGIESHTEAGIAPLQSKYYGEANTDLYTRIAWGYRSFPKGEAEIMFPDAGELYTSLATLIRSHLPRSGVFLDLGCGVGRTVFDAAQIAPEGLAIGLDLSLSKIARASAIVRGRTALAYPVREQEGLIEAQLQGQGQLNTAFGIGDAAHVLLADGSADCVLLGLVIGLVSDPQDLLRQVRRVLKPGGSLIIADPFDAFYDYDYPSDHRLTPSVVIQMLKRVVPEGTVEMIGPVPYKEHWAHSRTVTYDTILITARCKA
ncbi:MAG: methyltransferase domain-containing protein [Gammaproteobacteria bacterium]